MVRTCAVVNTNPHRYATKPSRPGRYAYLHGCNCVLLLIPLRLHTHYSAVMLSTMKPEEWKRLVGDRIRDRRQEVGIRSMRQAAKRAGFNEAVWRQLESGRRQIARGQFVTPTPLPETKSAACRVLRWPTDAIEILLTGAQPVGIESEADGATDTVAMLEEVAALTAELLRRARADQL